MPDSTNGAGLRVGGSARSVQGDGEAVHPQREPGGHQPLDGGARADEERAIQSLGLAQVVETGRHNEA